MESLLETHTLPIFDSRVGLTKEKRAPRTDVADTKYNLKFQCFGLSGSVRDGAAEQSRATLARGRDAGMVAGRGARAGSAGRDAQRARGTRSRSPVSTTNGIREPRENSNCHWKSARTLGTEIIGMDLRMG